MSSPSAIASQGELLQHIVSAYIENLDEQISDIADRVKLFDSLGEDDTWGVRSALVKQRDALQYDIARAQAILDDHGLWEFFALTDVLAQED